MPPLIPVLEGPEERRQSAIKIAPKHMVTIPQAKIAPAPVPKVQIPFQSTTRPNGTTGTTTAPLPFPLLILNGLPPGAGSQAIGTSTVKKETGFSGNTPNGK